MGKLDSRDNSRVSDSDKARTSIIAIHAIHSDLLTASKEAYYFRFTASFMLTVLNKHFVFNSRYSRCLLHSPHHCDFSESKYGQ
jgi:hypothetical protein